MDKKILLEECDFKAVRSSGPGGQHVNKTSTKVVLSWNLPDSAALSEDEKQRVHLKLSNRITKDENLVLSNDHSRSQLKNKEALVKNFLLMLEKALKRPKQRKKTRPTRNSKLRRLESKKRNSQKKADRRNPDF
ncbi:alternative ribosome rescue aminoacyl-tRNA hydrolase ArfB [Leeuwenhoekiella sp. A2]|uniref:alternative ribosome rescue aminoacyl-tRNA hydrolase ArfB n=1 Tax=Leeuwenhoekiella sp. A2 TaxID=3141460 RepID=UPI003A7F829A